MITLTLIDVFLIQRLILFNCINSFCQYIFLSHQIVNLIVIKCFISCHGMVTARWRINNPLLSICLKIELLQVVFCQISKFICVIHLSFRQKLASFRISKIDSQMVVVIGIGNQHKWSFDVLQSVLRIDTLPLILLSKVLGAFT